jgi:hypothetical protein
MLAPDTQPHAVLSPSSMSAARERGVEAVSSVTGRESWHASRVSASGFAVAARARAARPPREVAAAWLLAVLPLAAVFATYERVPPAQLYGVSGSGVRAALSRVVVELNLPVSLVALAVLAVVAGRLPPRGRALALVAAACCAVFAVPGVVRQSNLDARPINAVPALGVGLALACSLLAHGPASPRRARGDRLRVVLAAVLVLVSAPWIAAELGFYLDGVPLLDRLFQTGRIVSFHDAPHAAVHHGVHHGFQGLLLALTALLLSRLLTGERHRAEQARALLLSLVLAFGLANMANDGWLEQVVERGWNCRPIPSVLGFAANWLWLAALLSAAAIWLTWFGRPLSQDRT